MQTFRSTEAGRVRASGIFPDASEKLPIPDCSQDLICGFASVGTWAPPDEVNQTFDELARVLKPGSEVVLGALGLEEASPASIAYILGRFELVPGAHGINLILGGRTPPSLRPATHAYKSAPAHARPTRLHRPDNARPQGGDPAVGWRRSSIWPAARATCWDWPP